MSFSSLVSDLTYRDRPNPNADARSQISRAKSYASTAATSLILSSMVVRLSGPNRITTSSGTVAPSFSSSQRVMGMTGVSGGCDWRAYKPYERASANKFGDIVTFNSLPRNDI